MRGRWKGPVTRNGVVFEPGAEGAEHDADRRFSGGDGVEADQGGRAAGRDGRDEEQGARASNTGTAAAGGWPGRVGH